MTMGDTRWESGRIKGGSRENQGRIKGGLSAQPRDRVETTSEQHHDKIN